ncbi:hypothetical protein [Fructobacillus cardui]|uniref:hypothetical protein n=1 Tax=Fructobacillus cardui TaxID=2893170 RepID=UPI002009F58A|nr:hypothetical protein [Fructobacillus cardui]MCK8628166.1 hypothetical protein [Fructobacillus cardui]
MKTTIDMLITHYRKVKREAEQRNNEEYALLLIKNSRENISFQGRANFGTFMINSVPYNGLLVSQIILDNSLEGELSTLLVVNKRLFTLSSILAEDIMNLYEI